MGKKTKGKHTGLYFRGAYWWITRDPITGKPESTRCTDLEAAKVYLAQREREAVDPSYSAPRLGEQCATFIEMRKPRVSEATIGFFSQKLGHWVRIFGQDAPLSKVGSTAAFDQYIFQRRNEGVTDYTISKELKVFGQVLKMAKRAGHFDGPAFDELVPTDLDPSYVPRDRAMTLEEVHALQKALAPDLGALLDLSVALGCRLSEARKLEPADVDFLNGVAHIRGTKTADSDRVVPILSIFRPLLERAMPHLPIGSRNNIYRDVRTGCRRAGVEYASPNDWRRSHATILAEHGVDRDVTRRFLGHTSTEMVDRVYSRPRVAALAALAEASIATTAARSSGVVEVVTDGLCSEGMTVAKCSKSFESPSNNVVYLGLRSRRSVVRIHSGAPNSCGPLRAGRVSLPTCSDGVVTGLDSPERAWPELFAGGAS